MEVSLFTIIMTIIWSSLLIIVLYILRKKLLILEVCSVTGIISIYLFCALRLLLPIEVPWTHVIRGGLIWNSLQQCIDYELVHFNHKVILLGNVLLIIWIVIAVYKCIKIVENYRKLNKLVRQISKERVENEIASNAGVTVYKSENINSPCAVGIKKRLILLPYRNYSEQQIKYIIMHEVSHHKNQDIVIKLFTNILCALYWWNPCVYLLKKDINQSLEIRCDQNVTQCLEDKKRAEYLTVILEEFKNVVGADKYQSEYLMKMLEGEEDSLVERFKLVANDRYCTSLWKKIVLPISVIIILFASYSFVIQSSFDLPDMEAEKGVYLFDKSNSYIVLHKDGKYSLVTPYEMLNLNDGQVQFYLNENFPLKEE